MAGSLVQVEGLDGLLVAFRRISVEVDEEITWGLQEAAEPVRAKATEFILSGGGGEPALRNMSPTPYYAAMQIGVSRATKTVYVVPAWKARSSGLSRPKLAPQLQKRMEAALDSERLEVIKKIDVLIDHITRTNGF
jgi:hypothetical protein